MALLKDQEVTLLVGLRHTLPERVFLRQAVAVSKVCSFDIQVEWDVVGIILVEIVLIIELIRYVFVEDDTPFQDEIYYIELHLRSYFLRHGLLGSK